MLERRDVLASLGGRTSPPSPRPPLLSPQSMFNTRAPAQCLPGPLEPLAGRESPLVETKPLSHGESRQGQPCAQAGQPTRRAVLDLNPALCGCDDNGGNSAQVRAIGGPSGAARRSLNACKQRAKVVDVSAATAHRGLGFDEFWRQHCGWIARITFISFYAGTVSVWGAVLVFFVTAMETASPTIPIFLGICSAALFGALLLVRHTLREDASIVQRSLPRIEITSRGYGDPASLRAPASRTTARGAHATMRAHRGGPQVMC